MQPQDSRIQAAVATIGPDRPDDYLLAPSKHAAEYAESAPELAELLQWSEVRAAAETYEDLDQRAVEAQTRFMTASNRAGIAVFLAGIFGALLLVVANFSAALGEYRLHALLAVAIGGVIAGNLAAMWIYSVRAGGLFERWKTRRAEAEAERLRYFELVTGRQDLAEPLLQLEYFRRYQLDVQRAFFRSRGKRHEAGAGRALRTSSGALALGGITTGVAGVLAASLGPEWASLALLALVAQAFGVRAESQEASAQHRRNAERYLRTRYTLDRLYGRLDAVRAATAQGEREALQDFVTAVHEQLAIEHQEWQSEIGAAGEAIDRLESLLEKHQEKLGQLSADDGRVVQVQGAAFRTRFDAERRERAVDRALPTIPIAGAVAMPRDGAETEETAVFAEGTALEEGDGFDEGDGFEELAEFGPAEGSAEGARSEDGAGLEEPEGFEEGADVEQANVFGDAEMPEEEEMRGR